MLSNILGIMLTVLDGVLDFFIDHQERKRQKRKHNDGSTNRLDGYYGVD